MIRCAISLAAVAIVFATAAVPTRAEQIWQSDFSSTIGLTLNGAATTVLTDDGNVLRLVPANTWQGGSMFSTTMVDAHTFTSTFQFRITNRGGLGSGADGIVFVVQSVSNSAGGIGGGIGYEGIPKSVGVEFDTYQNGEHLDPSSNHLGIDINGVVDHAASGEFTVNIPTDFDDGNIWYGWVEYDGTDLKVWVDQSNSKSGDPILSRTLDIPSYLGQDTAFVGFTSATGSGYGNHDILRWTYTNAIPEPSTQGLLASGVLGIVACYGLQSRRAAAFLSRRG